MSYLSELCRFYDRMTRSADSGMPPEGMTAENIAFALEIDRAGDLIAVADLRDGKGRGKRLFVPARVPRACNVAANFLWDNTGYVLGVDGKGKEQRTRQTAEAFRALHRRLLAGCADPHAVALLAFLERWQTESFAALDVREALLDSNVVFRLAGEQCFFHEVPALREIWRAARAGGAGPESGVCLISGEAGAIARIHPSIKGVAGAQSSGAALISFNCPAFESYGKTQSFNAPVSEGAASAYTSALNYLLAREHRQMVRIADSSLIFWADTPVPEESCLGDLFDLASPGDTPQDRQQAERLKAILLALRRGSPLNEADAALSRDVRFFVLGLAPNAARLSVRFWLSSTLGAVLGHCGRWYADLAIERQFPEKEPEFPPLWLLLDRLSTPGRNKVVPPVLAGQLGRVILSGGRLPESLLSVVLGRIRAEGRPDYFRAALIKAWLCRNKHEEKDMTTLNTGEDNIGYRLGRVFALLEKAQRDALGKEINAPLRERYIGSASATPRLVFPMLLRLAQHHVTKAKKNQFDGYDVRFSRQIGEILADLSDFPAVLSLEDQGRFMLGYYHQNNANYRKNDAAPADAGEE